METKLMRYNPDGTVMAETLWRGRGDYTVVRGSLDEDGMDVLDSVGDMESYVDGYVNVTDAYTERPYFGWLEEG